MKKLFLLAIFLTSLSTFAQNYKFSTPRYAYLVSEDTLINANGDYSSDADTFKIAPSSSYAYYIQNIKIFIICDTLKAGYGEQDTSLVNGITLQYGDNNGIIWQINDTLNVKYNYDWSKVASYEQSRRLNDTIVYTTWHFNFLDDGSPLLLDGGNGGYLQFILHDDFSGLVDKQYFIASYTRK